MGLFKAFPPGPLGILGSPAPLPAAYAQRSSVFHRLGMDSKPQDKEVSDLGAHSAPLPQV